MRHTVQLTLVRVDKKHQLKVSWGKVWKASDGEDCLVIKRGDTALLLELAEYARDAVAAIVGMLWPLAVRAERDDQLDIPDQQAIQETIAITTPFDGF